jgi:hypothetical protein
MTLREFMDLPQREAEEYLVYLQLIQQREQAQTRASSRGVRGGGRG